MKRKKLSLAALSLMLSAGLLAGCTTNNSEPTRSPSGTPSPSHSASPNPSTSGSEGAVKTGLSIVADSSGSKNATAENDGQAATNMALVAVTVGDDGVIDACVIDEIQPKITFNAKGELTTEIDTKFQTKNELGEAYDMKKASGIGKEWNTQAASFAAYAVGKTVEELKGIAVDDAGKTTDTDLSASVTISVGDFISGIEAAVNNATHVGAGKGDKLALSTNTHMEKSKNATAEAEGQAQAYATMAAVTWNGDTITSCYIDAVQATVKFNASGSITSDIEAPVPSKNELGDAYGMKDTSGIGKEWNEQAAAFSAYVAGKTVDEVMGIAVDDSGKTTDADLSASVTIGIGEFQALIQKAAQTK